MVTLTRCNTCAALLVSCTSLLQLASGFLASPLSLHTRRCRSSVAASDSSLHAAVRSSHGAGRRRSTALRMAADYYQTLGLQKGASDADIKKAFRKLARETHPDVNSEPGAEDKFKTISAAYEVLSNPETKARYDQYGEAGLGAGFGGGGGAGGQGFDVDLGDIFESFFGGSGGGGRGSSRRNTGPMRGEDLRVDLDLDFKVACFGGEEKVRISHSETCDVCTGSGVKPGAKVQTCSQCNGQGVVIQLQRTPLGAFQSQATCPRCRGTGQQVDEYCGACSGAGSVERSKAVKVRIPPGVESGNKLRVRNEGDAGARGGPAGDLYVFLNVKEHPKFKRQGRDIYSDVTVNYLDAILGSDKIGVETIDGAVTMKVPSGTQPDTTLRIRGKGAPQLNNADNRGDHYVKVVVEIPKNLSKEETEIVKQLEALRQKKSPSHIP